MPRSRWAHGAAAMRGWRPWRSWVFWGVLATGALLRLGAVWTIRRRNPTVLNSIKQFNRRWLNPWMLRHAGGRHWYAGRLEHRGRRTGRPYATPLWIEPVREGFVALMPYGQDVDWARNLLAAGQAVIQEHSVRYRVGNPRVVPSRDLLPELPGFTRWLARLYGIDSHMRVDVWPNIDPEGLPSS